MKIGIIGSGNMGRALGVRFAQVGYEVFFGAREPEKAAIAASLAGRGSHSGNTDAAASFGDVVLWTMRESDPAKVLKNPSVLAGKIVIDLNNRDYQNEAKTGKWFEQAIAEKLQNHIPEAKVVKAFNTLAMESFDITPSELKAAGAQTFIAGADTEAKRQVAEIAISLGLEAVDLGDGPAAMRAAEALGDVIRLLMINGKRGSGAHFKVIALPKPMLNSIGKRADSRYA